MYPLPLPPPRARVGRGLRRPSRGRSLLRYLTLLCFDRLLGARVDPPSIQADRIFGRDGRAPELVPIRHAKRGDVVMRDNIISVLQHPIEGAGVSDEACPIRRLDQLLDKLV